jgi:hypothetical protein
LEFADGFPHISLVTVAVPGCISEDFFMTWLHHFQAHELQAPACYC